MAISPFCTRHREGYNTTGVRWYSDFTIYRTIPTQSRTSVAICCVRRSDCNHTRVHERMLPCRVWSALGLQPSCPISSTKHYRALSDTHHYLTCAPAWTSPSVPRWPLLRVSRTTELLVSVYYLSGRLTIHFQHQASGIGHQPSAISHQASGIRHTFNLPLVSSHCTTTVNIALLHRNYSTLQPPFRVVPGFRSMSKGDQTNQSREWETTKHRSSPPLHNKSCVEFARRTVLCALLNIIVVSEHQFITQGCNNVRITKTVHHYCRVHPHCHLPISNSSLYRCTRN